MHCAMHTLSLRIRKNHSSNVREAAYAQQHQRAEDARVMDGPCFRDERSIGFSRHVIKLMRALD